MEKKEKGFNLKLYATAAFFAVLAALVLITVFTFKAKYTAYHPEEVARNYVDTIAQTGDGYNAYKNALISKSQKYGDFIRAYYMNPVIYRDTAYKPGDDIKKCGYKGYNEESYMGEKSKNDDGSLQGQVIDTMYDYYVELAANGWDDYDTIFTSYFAKLTEVRKAVFGDDYMTDEIMFTVLEGNVMKYGQSLTGTEDEFDKNTGNQTSFKSIGAYQTAYGEDYKFTTAVKAEKEMDLAAYKSALSAETLATYGVQAADIGAVKCYTVTVSTEDGKAVAEADVVVAQIKNSWYVDNTATDTSSLYGFYK
ncbi:MAG: hypothetical protein K1V97_04775 [Lachnospiraceae bacterium]